MGANFWAKPSMKVMLITPVNLTNFSHPWSSCVILILLWICIRWRQFTKPAQTSPPIPKEEVVLTWGLFLMPVTLTVIAYATGGGMTPRYAMPAVVGYAAFAGFIASRVTFPLRAGLMALALTAFWAGIWPATEAALSGRLYERRGEAANELASLTAALDEKLPVVVSDGLVFLPMAHYTPADASLQPLVLLDPSAALRYSKSDTMDIALERLRRHVSVRALDYRDFAAKHSRFLLIGGNYDGDGGDWWPQRLKDDGHSVELLNDTGSRQVYRVSLSSEAISQSR
jgi:hypothetical protein